MADSNGAVPRFDKRAGDLDKPCAPIKVEVQVLYVAKVAEFVVDIVLLRLLVQPRDEDNPSLDGWRHGCHARSGQVRGGRDRSTLQSCLRQSRGKQHACRAEAWAHISPAP